MIVDFSHQLEEIVSLIDNDKMEEAKELLSKLALQSALDETQRIQVMQIGGYLARVLDDQGDVRDT